MRYKNLLFGFIAAVLPVLLLSTAGCGRKAAIKLVNPRRGLIRESFVGSGKTRLSKTYPVVMPVSGRIGRIEMEPGDKVKAGDRIAQFDRVPFEQKVIEARARVAEIKASMVVKEDNRLEETVLIDMKTAVKTAEEYLKASDAQVQAAKAGMQRADKELNRKKALFESGAIQASDLDDAQLAADTSTMELRSREFNRAALKTIVSAVKLGPRLVEEYLERKSLELKVISEQLVQANARIERASHEFDLAQIVSPVDGIVLERYEQGDSSLPAGTRLLLIGNLNQMEAVVDVLTQDAMKLSNGSTIILKPALGPGEIKGRVKRIEPAGFTKLSSLGVEQQRVNVIVSLKKLPPGLGVGYRLQARFFTREKKGALIVPRYSVLQAPDQSYYVFKIDKNNRLRKQVVRLGLRSDLELEILDGLSRKDTIVAIPGSNMHDGDKT